MSKLEFGLLILVAVFLFLSGVGVGSIINNIDQSPGRDISFSCPSSDVPNITRNDLTCPVPNVTIEEQYSNIQGAHQEVSIEKRGDDIVVEDIDYSSRPTGYSMRPTIFSGNTVIGEEYTGENLDSGQIIAYDDGDGTTIHRVKGDYLESSGYVTAQGDNTDYEERVQREDINYVIVGVLYTPEL